MPRKGQRRYKGWLTEGFPGWLRERLEEREWLAVDLAEKINVNSGVISNYMTGARTPDPKMLQRIADVLSVSDEEIFTAAGYLREMPLTDDPRRLELQRRIGVIDLTPDRYDMLNTLLTSWQGHRPSTTETDSGATFHRTSRTTRLPDDPIEEERQSAPRAERTLFDMVG